MADPRRFIVIWLAALLGLAAVVVAVNLLVDPYEVFGTPRIAGISDLKPGAKNHSMLAKTYQVARAHPVTVLIGSSTTHIGINAIDPAWPPAMQPVYNYGIPGGYATSSILRTLQEAVAQGGVRNAVVFLDFQNFFVAERTSGGPTEDERRFHLMADGSANPYRRRQVADDMFLSLATMGALVDSVMTVSRQRTPNLLNLAANGSSTDADFSNAARADGMFDLFAQKNALEAIRAAQLARLLDGWHDPLPNLQTIAGIIALAHANHVGLTLVITPHHADTLELYWRGGLWPRIEQFKVELAALVAGEGVALWDFMDYDTYATEAVPSSGDRQTATRSFWEPTHFKRSLGHLMLERMFDHSELDFGAILTMENVQLRNDAIRGRRQALVCVGHVAFLTTLRNPADPGCLSAASPRTQRNPT